MDSIFSVPDSVLFPDFALHIGIEHGQHMEKVDFPGLTKALHDKQILGMGLDKQQNKQLCLKPCVNLHCDGLMMVALYVKLSREGDLVSNFFVRTSFIENHFTVGVILCLCL